MKKLQSIVLLLVLLQAFATYAGEGTWLRRYALGDLAMGGYELRDRSRVGMDAMPVENYKGYLYLDYTRKLQTDLSNVTQWKLRLSYNYVFNGSTVSGFLEIDHKVPSNGESVYEDFAEIQVNNSFKGYQLNFSGIQVSYDDGVTWSTVSNYSTSGLPQDVDVRMELRSERVFDLSLSSDKTGIVSSLSDYTVRWDYIQGAESYDLEWVHIDAESKEAAELALVMGNSALLTAGGYAAPFEKKEASRVRVWQTHYTLDKTYSKGYLYFRVRPVSSFSENNQTTDDIRTGSWSYFKITNTGAQIESTELARLYIPTTYEDKKNWVYGVSFAEEGKSVSSLTYFDGSNRGRQNLVFNTSDNITLISESKYDYEGRQTVSVIPAPVKGRQLGYRSNFNLALNQSEFSEEDFDINNPTPLYSPTSGESGAAQYFSATDKITGEYNRVDDYDGYGNVKTSVYKNTKGQIVSNPFQKRQVNNNFAKSTNQASAGGMVVVGVGTTVTEGAVASTGVGLVAIAAIAIADEMSDAIIGDQKPITVNPSLIDKNPIDMVSPPFAIPIPYASADGYETTWDDEGYIVLFRGVSDNRPTQFHLAQTGTALPIGGPFDAEEHNMGNTESPYTSWTRDPYVAYQWAMKNASQAGIVLVNRFHLSELTKSLDMRDEAEVLVAGPIYGAIPITIPRMLFAK